MPDTLPTVDAFFGAPPLDSSAQQPATTPAAAPDGTAPAPSLPTVDQFFSSPTPQPQSFLQKFNSFTAPPGQDEFLAQGSVGKILDAFGQGAKQGWGTGNVGLSDETTDWLKKVGLFNDVSKGQTSLIRSFNEGLFRPLAAGLDTVNRALGAGQSGVGAGAAETATELGQPELGRDIGGIVESFGGLAGSPGALGAPHGIPDLQTSRDLGAIGHDEGVYFGTEEPKPGEGPVAQAGLTLPEKPVEAQAATPEAQAAEGAATQETPTIAPDVHAVARQIAPEVFQGPRGFDALSQQQDTFRRWIDELGQTRDQAATADIDTQIADTQGRLEDATGKRAATYRDRLSDLQDQRQDALDAANKDTPDMARVRQDLLDTQFKMRDLAPQVTAAYREAQSRLPVPEEVPPNVAPEETAQAEPSPAPVQPVPETETGNEPGVQGVQPPVSAPVAAANEPGTPSGARAIPIADDIKQQLVSAGRPEEEADAASQLAASRYDARASNLKGETAENLYDKDAPKIEGAARGRKGEMGRTIVKDSQKTIRLMANADASTFIHESGHQYLEELMQDAGDDRATDQVKQDAQTVRDWLGAKEGEDIKTRQHEKFARGFERYMMEGHAPTPALANVFAKFKGWLTNIYQTVSKLRSPITDDIRDVFDRLISKPDEGTVIAPEREAGKEFADIHEADAEHTPPEKAAGVADNVRSEIDQIAKEKEPELYGKLNPGSEAGGIETENADNPSGGNGPEPEPATAGAPVQPGAVAEGGNTATPEGADVGAKPSPASGNTAGGARRPATDPAVTVSPRESVLDKAGNIRPELLNFDDADAAADLLHRLAGENSDFTDARYGTRAYQWANDVKAAGQMVVETVNRAVEAEKAWLENGSDEASAEYVTARAQAVIAADLLNEVKAGSGRALAANRRVPRIAEAQAAADFIKDNTGKTLFQLRNEGKLLNQLPDAAQKAKFLKDESQTTWQKVRAGILSYFINNLLSGPLTHTAYLAGNTVWATFKATADTSAAAAIGSIREAMAGEKIDRVEWGEVGAQLYAIARGARDSYPAAVSAFKTGIPFMKGLVDAQGELGNLTDMARDQAIPGKLGYVLETPSRSVAAIHTVGYAMHYEMGIARRAFRQAASEGLEGDAFNTRVAEYTQNPPPDVVAQVHDEALEGVLMRRPAYGGSMSHIQQAINGNIFAKIALPFIQVSNNLVREGVVDHSLLAFATKDARDDLSGVNGDAARDIQKAKIVVGSGIALGVVGLTAEGTLTGAGPSDPKKLAALQETGWKQFSIRIGDNYIPYRRFIGPLADMIAVPSVAYEVGHSLSEQGLGAAVKSSAVGLAEVVADENWMGSLSDLLDAARHWDSEEGARYLRNLSTDFIPVSLGLKQIANMTDDTHRQVRSELDALRANIPGVSHGNYPVRNVLTGMPVQGGNTNLSVSAVDNDPVKQAINQLEQAGQNAMPAPFRRDINGVQLTEKQYDDYVTRGGVMTHQRLAALITPAFQAQMASDPVRATKTITEQIKGARAAARQQVLIQSDIQDGQNSIRIQSSKVKHAQVPGMPTQ